MSLSWGPQRGSLNEAPSPFRPFLRLLSLRKWETVIPILAISPLCGILFLVP